MKMVDLVNGERGFSGGRLVVIGTYMAMEGTRLYII